MESTVNITAADGKAEATILVGKDYRILEDHTRETFRTDSLPDFVKYATAYPRETHCVYYCTDEVVLRDMLGSRYAVDTASCAVRPSPLVLLVETLLNKPMSIGDFESFLFTIRPYMDDALKILYSYVRNFKMTKVTEIKRIRDNRGNYEYVVKREKGGQDEVEIPETITLSLPPMVGATDEDKADFTLDLLFDYKDTSDGVVTEFKLVAPLFGKMLSDAIKATIRKYIDALPHTAYWGAITNTKQDDSWKYLFNEAPPKTVVASGNARVERPF